VTSFVTEALNREHDRSAFRSGVEALDRYLQEFAFQDIKRRIAGCIVAIDDARRIAGYYTLAATSVALDALPPEVAKRLPRYPVVPAVLIGRLAVAAEYQRQGLGSSLIADAVIRTERLGIGAYALIVDAKDERARTFYQASGFALIPGESRRLFLPIATALAAGRGSGIASKR
jgi:GNAT superfamily N-acetyltransferase